MLKDRGVCCAISVLRMGEVFWFAPGDLFLSEKTGKGMFTVKKGILVVSFGTSYAETRDKTIGAIEAEIRSAHPDFEVRRAFTSKMIISKLKKRDGIYIDTPEEALERMAAEGFEEITVQPLHIIPGFEYEKVQKAVVIFRHKHKIPVSIGRPLLYGEEDYDEMVQALLKDIPEKTEGQAVLFMGHGTEHFANACYSMLQNKISEERSDVFIANVEGYPELDVVAEKIVGKFNRVVLAPIMIVAGDHALNDMAGDEDSFKSFFEEKGLEVECRIKGLGENPEIRRLFARRLAAGQ